MKIEWKLFELSNHNRKVTIWPWDLDLWSQPLFFSETCNLRCNWSTMMKWCWYVENSLCESVSKMSTNRQTDKQTNKPGRPTDCRKFASNNFLKGCRTWTVCPRFTILTFLDSQISVLCTDFKKYTFNYGYIPKKWYEIDKSGIFKHNFNPMCSRNMSRNSKTVSRTSKSTG